MSEEKHTYADKFVYFWFVYLLAVIWCLAFDWDGVLNGLTFALLLTTPLRHRWL